MSASRTRIAALVAPVLVVGGLGSPARSADPKVRGWVLTRTGSAPARIEGTIEAKARSEESSVVLFALAGQGAQRRVDYRFVTSFIGWGVDGWAQVHSDGVPVPGCVAACSSPVGVPQTATITANDRAIASTVYVAAYDVADPVLSITSPGWRVRPWTPAMRLLTTATASGTRIGAAHETVGTYRGGALPGGAFGSFVFATLPCDPMSREGTGALRGGRRPWQMDCETAPHAADGAPRRTRWTATADVTGASGVVTVLAVVDYPRG